MKKFALGFVFLVTVSSIPALAAGSASVNLPVSASIGNNCTIATAPVAFGVYDPVGANLATPLDGAGNVQITCTKGAATTVTLGLGANATGATRRMTDGAANFLSYEAYQPPNNSPGTACAYGAPVVWGTAGINIFTPAVAPSTATRTYNVCGRVAAGQDQPAGAYTDTVLATVNF